MLFVIDPIKSLIKKYLFRWAKWHNRYLGQLLWQYTSTYNIPTKQKKARRKQGKNKT